MPTPLRVLILEDRPADAELMLHELRRAGYQPTWTRVETEAEYLKHQDLGFDVILADYTLPQFDALSALYRLQERGQDIPLLIVSGSISEEVAVECMKQGAADYLLKDRLGRLGQAVSRALEQKRIRDEKRQAEAALAESEARHRTIAELTSDYAYALSVAADGALSCEWITSAFTRVTGHELADVASPGGWSALVHPDDRSLAARRWHALLAGTSDVSEYRIVTRSGETRIVRDHSRPVWDGAAKRVVRIYGAAEDITERKQVEEELERLALYDILTGLPNRTLFHDRLRHGMATTIRGKQPLALLLLDLDRFREVNDALGHAAGDELLRQVSKRLCSVLRASDTVARLGGDEFAILMAGADRGRASLAASRLSRVLEQPFVIDGQSIQVRASIGIALSPDHGQDEATLLRRADVAVYLAKRANGEYFVYSPEQDTYSPTRLALMGGLRKAIEGGELRLLYQPKLSLAAGRITGVEALVRWQHPEHGLLLPSEFIPLAEQTGLIEPLTRWAVGTALEQSRAWQAAGLRLPIAVNLAARSLHDLELPDTLSELLAASDVDPGFLQLEVTESMVITDPLRARDVLARLRAMGLQIAIDDFGTGHSALAYLNLLPLDELKIDRSFVTRLAHDSNAVEIVRSTIVLGHNLKLSVTAEGVEDSTCLDLLRGLGCDVVQGFYVSPPQSADELLDWLQQGPWAVDRPGPSSQPAQPAPPAYVPSSTALPASPPARTAAATR